MANERDLVFAALLLNISGVLNALFIHQLGFELYAAFLHAATVVGTLAIFYISRRGTGDADLREVPE
jgi:uncharacterized membrane protein YjjB (DUF3815 family)